MGERTILKVIADELTAMNITYYYMVNDSNNIIYPYVTGEYFENSYSFEDNSTVGEVLLTAWTRGSELSIITIKDLVKNKFNNYQKSIKEETETISMSINYLSKTPVHTGEEGLKKLEMRLQVKYWESD